MRTYEAPQLTDYGTVSDLTRDDCGDPTSPTLIKDDLGADLESPVTPLSLVVRLLGSTGYVPLVNEAHLVRYDAGWASFRRFVTLPRPQPWIECERKI